MYNIVRKRERDSADTVLCVKAKSSAHQLSPLSLITLLFYKNNRTEQNNQKLTEHKSSKTPCHVSSMLTDPSSFSVLKNEGGLDTLLGGLGVVILALLTGGSLAVPGGVCPQCRRAVETVLILQAIRPIVLRVLQTCDQTLVLVTKLPSHQSGLSHHHHVLKGTARAGTYYPHNTGGCAE